MSHFPTSKNQEIAVSEASRIDSAIHLQTVRMQVHACVAPESQALIKTLKLRITEFLMLNYVALQPHSIVRQDMLEKSSLARDILSIQICEANPPVRIVKVQECEFDIIPYTHQDLVEQDEFCCFHTLPSLEMEGLWESLCLEPSLKQNLLDYVLTCLLFSDRQVDSTLVSVNHVVLLHGPPGRYLSLTSGKTTLCKGLAQQLSIRLSERYACGKLVQLNTNSLFSKYFAESARLVHQLFENLTESLKDNDTFVCLVMGSRS